MRPAWILPLVIGLGVVVGSPKAAAPRSVGTRPVRTPAASTAPWGWPLSPAPAVRRAFAPPPTAYARGHRGVDLLPVLDATEPVPVLAVADGVVTHVGVIDGRGTVTLTHAPGLRSTYEPVRGQVRVGQRVHRGETLGVLDGPSHCDPALTCLHLGASQDGVYVDPLRRIRGSPVVLLPLHSSP